MTGLEALGDSPQPLGRPGPEGHRSDSAQPSLPDRRGSSGEASQRGDDGQLDSPVRRGVVSFGRRDGRRQGRYRRVMPDDLAWYVVEVEPGAHDASVDPAWVFDAVGVFRRSAPLVVEIGSGTGESVVAGASAHPEWDHLAVEVYRPGAMRTIGLAADAQVMNLRILQVDGAALVATGLAPGSVREIRVFFPDPWPKKRQHKRRLVDDGFLADVARVLQPGGVLRLATDWEHYALQMREAVQRCAALDNPYARHAEGWAPRFSGRPQTHFERKGVAAGRRIYDLEAHRPLCRASAPA